MTFRNRPPVAPNEGMFKITKVEPLAGPEVHFDGQIIGLVTAETYETARDAAHRLVVHYAAETPTALFQSPGVRQAPTKAESDKVDDDPKLGDAEAALGGAAHVVEAHYSTPAQHHNSMELYSTTASWNGDELTIDKPSQFVYGLREALANQLAMPRDKVHVRSEYLGGAFGGKGAVMQRTVLVALAAKALSRPVKLVATRDQGFTISGHRQETRHRIKLGTDAQGRLVGADYELWELTSRTDAYANGGIDAAAAMYRLPSFKSKAHLDHADRNTPTFMRSPPEFPVLFALESAMDEMAEKAGIDPIEFRRINDTDKDWITGKPYSTRSLMKCYDEGARAFGWHQRGKPGARRAGDWLVGYGCATAAYPTQMATAIVRLTLTRDVNVRADIAAADVGTGAKTAIGQSAAHYLGIDPARVTVRVGDSTLPPGPVAGGSVTTASSASAIKLAVEKIHARLGNAAAGDDEARHAAFDRLQVREIVKMGEYSPEGTPPGSAGGRYQGKLAFSMGKMQAHTQYAMGAELVEVHVHARTREVRVPRIVGAFAAGRIVNPRTAHSQLMGGMIWGISSALHEATEVDPRRAAYINNNLAEYLIPVNADIGKVDVILVPEVDEKVNPAGIKGLGELGNVGTAAAVCNAIYNATGTRIRDLPVRIEKLLAVRSRAP